MVAGETEKILVIDGKIRPFAGCNGTQLILTPGGPGRHCRKAGDAFFEGQLLLGKPSAGRLPVQGLAGDGGVQPVANNAI